MARVARRMQRHALRLLVLGDHGTRARQQRIGLGKAGPCTRRLVGGQQHPRKLIQRMCTGHQIIARLSMAECTLQLKLRMPPAPGHCVDLAQRKVAPGHAVVMLQSFETLKSVAGMFSRGPKCCETTAPICG